MALHTHRSCLSVSPLAPKPDPPLSGYTPVIPHVRYLYHIAGSLAFEVEVGRWESQGRVGRAYRQGAPPGLRPDSIP